MTHVSSAVPAVLMGAKKQLVNFKRCQSRVR